MPCLDMPLEQLREYTGINPRPDDFDEFWDNGLSDLFAWDPDEETIPAAFAAPFARCEHFYFDGVGGARIHAKVARPIVMEGPAPAVLLFHGYSASSGDWICLLPWAAAGFIAVALDCRGQGGLSEDPNEAYGGTMYGMIVRGLESESAYGLYYRNVFLDCARLAQLVGEWEDVDEDRLAAIGGSQGGALAVVAAALEPKIARLAPQYPFLSDYQRVWEMDLDKHAYDGLRQWFRRFDPLHKRENEVFHKLGYIDVHHLASRVRARTLMAISLLDDICPPSTQFAVYNQILAEKECRLYPDFGHEGLPGWQDEVFTFIGELG